MTQRVVIHVGPPEETYVELDGVRVEDLVHFRVEQGVQDAAPVLILAVYAPNLTVEGDAVVKYATAEDLCPGCGRTNDICVCPPHMRKS